jgi:hypothetical protein
MKFSSIALLAVASMTGSVSASVIADRWKLDEPVIVYTAATNLFSLNFVGKASTDNNLSTGATKVEFYDRRCQSDGTAAFNSGFGAGATGSDAKLVDANGYKLIAGDGIGSPNDQTLLPTWDTSLVEFRVDTQLLAQNPKIYDTIDQTMIDNEAISDVTNADLDFGLMRFCARTEIGYLKPVVGTAPAEFQDVNFIETLVNIKYDLTAGFSVEAFSVAPKQRIAVTESKNTYELDAWLCDPTSVAVSELGTSALGQVNRILPPRKELIDSVTGNAIPFKQGELVTVCVAPDNNTYRDGIQLNGLTDFTWSRDNSANSLPDVTQQAIPIQTQALSAMVGGCALTDYCRFSTILFADFYTSVGQVSGLGNAVLAFRTTPLDPVGGRKLRGVESAVESFVPGRRQLQEETSSPFDLSVDISTGTEGPGAIKTAGGASYGFSALASAVALLSAALLA